MSLRRLYSDVGFCLFCGLYPRRICLFPFVMPNSTHNVNFFATCMGTAALQESTLNAIKLLQQCGAHVIFKRKQTCCGQPAYNTGYPQEAKDIALYNMALFADNDYPIVVPAGSCAGLMSKEYPELFAHDNADTQEMVRRFCQCIPQQKALLQQLSNVEYVPLPYEEECCGFGGTFSVMEPEISGAIVGEKIKHIQETGVKVVIAADNGCILNISGALQKQGISDIKVLSLYDFIYKRINGEAI